MDPSPCLHMSNCTIQQSKFHQAVHPLVRTLRKVCPDLQQGYPCCKTTHRQVNHGFDDEDRNNIRSQLFC